MVFRLPRDCKYLLHLPESMLASWLSHTAPYPKASPPMGFPLPSYSRLLITLLFWFCALSLSSSLMSPHSLFHIMVRCRFLAIFHLQPSLSALNSSRCPRHTLSHVHNKNCADPYLGAVMLSIYTSYICICTITFNLYSFSIPLSCIHHKFLSKCLFNFPI